jgi:hypothetical protein
MGEIGPLMCQREREDVALDLLKVVLSRLKGYDISMYVSSAKRVILGNLSKLGFTESFRVARMFLGPPIGENCINMAESLERG